MASHAAPTTTPTRRRWWNRLFTPHSGRRFQGAPPLPPRNRPRHARPALAAPASTQLTEADPTRPFRAIGRAPYEEPPLVRSAYDTLARLARLDQEEG